MGSKYRASSIYVGFNMSTPLAMYVSRDEDFVDVVMVVVPVEDKQFKENDYLMDFRPLDVTIAGELFDKGFFGQIWIKGDYLASEKNANEAAIAVLNNFVIEAGGKQILHWTGGIHFYLHGGSLPTIRIGELCILTLIKNSQQGTLIRLDGNNYGLDISSFHIQDRIAMKHIFELLSQMFGTEVVSLDIDGDRTFSSQLPLQ